MKFIGSDSGFRQMLKSKLVWSWDVFLFLPISFYFFLFFPHKCYVWVFLFGEMDDILSKILNLSSLIKWTSGRFHLVYSIFFSLFLYLVLSLPIYIFFFALFNWFLFFSVSDVSDLKFLMIYMDAQEFVCLFWNRLLLRA